MNSSAGRREKNGKTSNGTGELASDQTCDYRTKTLIKLYLQEAKEEKRIFLFSKDNLQCN